MIDTSQLELSADALRELLERGEPITVLDIRRTPDRAEWSIPGSVHLDVFDAVGMNEPSALDQFQPPPGRPVVTVCYQGNNSLLAMKALRARGVPALSLHGGMHAWSLMWNIAEIPVSSPVRILQVRRTGKGCLSYLVGSGGDAAVIDPAVEPEVFLQLASERGWTIRHVLETHVHADHLSRARSLADRAGATLHYPIQQRVQFDFLGLAEGERVMVGGASITAMHTPGHTFESTCYLLDQQALVTGDTLFLDSVGRPDLAAKADEETRRRARLLHQSLRRLTSLSPDLLVLPGHSPTPVAFDHAGLYARLGDVVTRVKLLQMGEAEFVEAILGRIPSPPANHLRIVRLNETGERARNPRELEAGANRCAIG